MELTFETAGASGTAVAHVSELTGAKVRIFLSEIAEGVSNYRSMHSLTQQVEHQYHGRFLIELVQNAHDAFTERAADGQNRIDIVFDQADSIHGSLLVANDGAPFSASNFERLSQLGQSDKDPQKSIGNKGIGFRSVLEVSDCPEIYSRNAPGSPGFDGYCFAFRPDVVQSLVEPINQLSKSGPVPVWPISGEPLVNNWSDEMLAKFRKRVQSKAEGWLAGEAHFLSPYLLPVPLTQIDSERVADYASRGFATVVRLPLKSAELRNYVLERMRQLSGATMLFLNRVGTLHIAADEGEERTFTRKSTQLAPGLNGERVVILDDSSAPREYGIWTRGLHVATAPEVFRKAVAALPGRWPDITDISVSVAVRLDADPENGRFSIYLPTLVPTGSAVHINAPFFGDMSRTSIPFEDAYNRHLLDVAADLSLEVVRSRLAGKGETEARAILDFLAPLDTGPAGQRWLQLMVEAETRSGAALNEESLVLAEDGWQALNMTSLVPTAPKITLLTEDTLRRHATFHIFHSSLASRVAQIKSLAAARFSATGAYPLASDLAVTIAAVAGELHTGGGDWNAFWRDTAALLPAGQAELAKHAVLLGADGALHRVSSGTRVFFVPRQGTQDDSDVGGEATATGVPAMLQPSVAFLNEQIQLYDPSRPAMQTPVRAYLGQGLVSQFRVETIFSEVLLQLTPAMPASIDGAHLPLCRDILGWALRLMANVVARGRGVEATLRLLRAIPVPCEGGWLPMREASFSEGWPSTVGPTLKAYLGTLKSGAANTARQRLLLPPSHPSWGEVGTAQMSLLASGGVLNGLRLLEIKPNAWASGFKASMFDFRLPGPPPLISKEQWSQFATIACAESKPPFTTPQQYEVGNVLTFPGMAEFESLAEEERLALSELILQSLPGWGAGLQKLVLSKQGGQWSRLEVTSPLKHFLQSTPWLSIREAKGPTWAQPRERWFVPADTLAGRARHYAHLRALPSGLAKHIGLHPELAAVLRDLGMKFFDPHSTTADPSLLQTLTESVGSDDVSDANVLLGQLRDAWQRFRPPIDRASLPMLAVRRRDRRLSTVTPSADSPAYLPDSGAYAAELEEFDFPVVAIGTADAKELREWFIAAYGARIQLTSTLALVPYVGDAVWTGSTATALADSELGWLVHPLLVMVAAQGRSVHSAAFKDREELLRSAQIDWVPNLRVAVMRETTALANTEVTALWEPLRKTLVIAEYCRTHPEALSGALAQALEREDLELSLRYVLRTVDMIDEAPDDLATFLAPLRITPEQIHQVLEHLRGDVGHMSRLVALLVAVLSPAADLKALKDARTEEELTTALAEVGISGLDVAHTLQVARDSQDMFDFGRAISPDFGEPASLAHWNAELIRLGQTQLANKRWGLQLQASMEEAAASAKRLAAHALRQGAMVSYTQMYSQYQGLVSSADLSHSHWTVTFQDAMTLFERLAASWLSDVGVLLAVQSAENPEMLRAGLADAGVPLEMDPDECGRKNHALVDSVARGLDRLRLVAWIRASVNLPNQEWHPFVDRYRAAAEAALAGDAFTREWPEAHVLALLRSAVRHPDLATFQTELDLSTDLASLQEALQVSGDELSKAQGQLDAIRTERMRRRSIVQVCGEDFDSSEDNLDQLWAFLSTKISDSDLAKTMSLNLVSPVALVPVKGRSPTRSDTSKPPARRPQRQSKSTDELVGLAGEIHVFRMLRQQYGEDAVPSSAWISENSRRVFGFNQADDARGCDFAFTVKGKQFRVEVKASTGDDESFTLGSSEIRLAMEIGTKAKRRREVFVLVHVKNALSPAPSAVVLPNPYDPKHTGVFRVEEADARVRYRVRK